MVCGAAGFIGSHLVAKLKQEGLWVRGVDRHRPDEDRAGADHVAVGDLRDPSFCADVFDRRFDEVYQFAAEMGGAEYIYSGVNDAELMSSSLKIDINVLDSCRRWSIGRVFFSSSACVYPKRNQIDPEAPDCAEETAYPADPDSEYGWAKLMTERLYLAYGRNFGIEPRIARFHNVFGPHGAWQGARAKAPAALCRKVAEAASGGEVEIIGDGQQSRSFLYVSEGVEGAIRLARSGEQGPLNIGSDEMVTIDHLADLIMKIAGKVLRKKHVAGPVGVRGRNSDNRLIRERLGWAPSEPLVKGLERTYAWVEEQVRGRRQRHAQ